MSTDTSRAQGIPGVIGRWQPTRAGVLNSWKWTDEEFLFADGWLAFVGRNGSGKSLTASQLVTVLLDGDTSQTALSVSGRAGGTLMSRHTDNRDKDDRTGVWWLEYGRTDSVTGATEYVTTGLWLRSSTRSLLRAFFVLPGRVGAHLTLRTDRNAVSIESLAQQLAARDGELFTDAQRLESKAAAHLRSIGPESGYRTAVRTRLFAPLDELQYDALLSVLRTLRSVRTAEKISARDMLEVLTSAMPALDQAKLNEIAGAMQRIATLERELANTKEQSRKLAATDRGYELYRKAVAMSTAAALRSANTDFDNLTRSQRAAEKDFGDAESSAAKHREAWRNAGLEVSRLDGEVRAAETALRDHAGAELPHHEDRAEALEATAKSAEERAEESRNDAARAHAAATQAGQDARAAQQSLTAAVQDLSRTGNRVDAGGALTTLISATAELTRPDRLDPDAPPADIAVDELAATPRAWVDMRRAGLDRVTAALGEMNAADRSAREATDQHRAAEDEAGRRNATLTACANARGVAGQRLEAAIIAWQQSAEFFPPVPGAILQPDAVQGRIEPARITQWVGRQADAIRVQLDVPGHRIRKEAADRSKDQAGVFAADRRAAAAEADAVVAEVQVRHDEHRRRSLAAVETEADAERAAETEHHRLVDAAGEHLHIALLAQLDRTGDLLRTLIGWHDEVRKWRSGLRHLHSDGLVPPALPAGTAQQLHSELAAARAEAGDRLDRAVPAVGVAERSLDTLTGYDDWPLRTALTEAAQLTFARLNRRIAEAGAVVARCRERAEETTADLIEARKAPSPPPAPSWRTRSEGSPLWSLLDFRDDLPAGTRNQCEGALLVSGILDAVVTADGRARAGDTVLTGELPAQGPNLADLLTVEPDSPIDATRTLSLLRSISVEDSASGTTIRTGVLAATSPANYICSYIGTTARERARAERVAALESRLRQCDADLKSAELERRLRQEALDEAKSEVEALPSSAAWQAARRKAHAAQLAAREADHEAARRRSRAEADLRSVRETLAGARRDRAAALATINSDLDKAGALAQQAAAAASDAAEKAEQAAGEAILAGERLDTAIAGQSRADDERQRFPSVEALLSAIADEDDATRQSITAETEMVKATERMRKAQKRSRQASLAVDRAVDVGSGRPLPADATALRGFAGALTQFAEQVHTWQRSVDRTLSLCAGARAETAASIALRERAERQAREATGARTAAVSAAAQVRKLRALHGAEYESLREAHEQSRKARDMAKDEAERARDEIGKAQVAAAGARSTLDNITPQRETAERVRERWLQQMNRLADESIATVGDGIPVDGAGRPANLTAALAWGSRMLTAEGRNYSRDDIAKLLEARRLRLEAEAKRTSAELVRFDRQITLHTIPGTDWRRAIVATADSAVGEDLHETVLALRQTAEQLEADLRDDVKDTLKTSMFTALRREIATRRAAAQELVRQIRVTLGGVRTGVARVGVEVDWKVKRDPDAQKMIELVGALPSDETFQQMYEVLHQRLEDATGDSWEARVAHTFDYRAWHEWDIRITHASFGDGTTEVFRPLTARSNPLASFSTGEMRLATMLPLLAAAWSMYETPGYHGPRLLFVDEMNAAFDPQNVRKLLALLRTWDFDVLSTAPEMSALLRAEAEQVMIVQVTHAGEVGVAVPWLWTGSGQPMLVGNAETAS
ncbi:SbcC/MukB-like Walker B domain-containing protein [Nocardia sp. CNY236]|uniref:SbcC/MukB-like Walker B domain-containing protein n=1 Tax=Nocardia sp. CNY236 TaxID=1169152 RepID=UPI000412490D|nr:SbcC/MukB-like Walker B domain-containing protein [Nocardia sp. CNY236]